MKRKGNREDKVEGGGRRGPGTPHPRVPGGSIRGKAACRARRKAMAVAVAFGWAT